jgi:hypothetical protein
MMWEHLRHAAAPSDDIGANTAACRIAQLSLRLQYRELLRNASPLPDFADVEFRCYSQNSEDGILHYLFSLLGATTRKSVEIGAGDGIECNTANLIVNHGWKGLLIDGNAEQLARGKEFYARCRDTYISPPTLVSSWMTAENINKVVTDNGFAGEIDLLSLDIDGIDYWVWQALDCVTPKVVVLEFNALGGAEKSLTIPYRPDFQMDYVSLPYRFGATLTAFVKLSRRKGYRLVGVQSLGYNAFFVRAGVGEKLLPERSPQECFEQSTRLRDWEPSWLEAMLAGGGEWEEV